MYPLDSRIGLYSIPLHEQTSHYAAWELSNVIK